MVQEAKRPRYSLRSVLIISGILIVLGMFILGAEIVNLNLAVSRLADEEAKAIAGAREAQLVRYDVMRLQDGVTDGSLTGSEDAKEKAQNAIASARERLLGMAKDFPKDAARFAELTKQIESLKDTGLEMLEAYQTKGKAAGDLIMKRPDTGTDARSDAAAESLGRIIADYESVQKMKTAELRAEMDLAMKLQTASLIGVGILVAFALLSFYRRILPLHVMITSISSSADEVGTASTELSQASEQLSNGASSAASSLEETVASLEELSSMVKRNAENSKETNAISERARATAEAGEREVCELIQAMSDINRSSRKIEEIIAVIDDIAFQTNLLALNAAVEAARAGEQGKGFAVVAEAVRALAQRSQTAARDITNLITESVRQVEHGATIAERSGKTLSQIVESSKQVASLNGEIAAASREQSTGLEQITSAVTQLDRATQGNAASAEETASASERLSYQSETMRNQVLNLIALVQGAGAQSDETATQQGEMRRSTAA